MPRLGEAPEAALQSQWGPHVCLGAQLREAEARRGPGCRAVALVGTLASAAPRGARQGMGLAGPWQRKQSRTVLEP